MNDYPRGYLSCNLPPFGKYKWHGYVADYCKIADPQFHGGNTVAIRLFDKERDKPHPQGWPWPGERGKTDWIAFKSFEDANAYVQAVKKLSQ